MIAKLYGTIDNIYKNFVILNVQGVGYKVFCSRKTIDHLPEAGENCVLFIESIVREDFIHLYGFFFEDEQEWFNTLISVQGVGMKAALAILSVASPDDLFFAIQSQDKSLITMAEGIGPKLGTRIINELKDKIGHITVPSNLSSLSTLSPIPIHSSARQDAVLALLKLDYRLGDIQQILKHAEQEKLITAQDIIKFALKYLAKTA